MNIETIRDHSEHDGIRTPVGVDPEAKLEDGNYMQNIMNTMLLHKIVSECRITTGVDLEAMLEYGNSMQTPAGLIRVCTCENRDLCM